MNNLPLYPKINRTVLNQIKYNNEKGLDFAFLNESDQRYREIKTLSSTEDTIIFNDEHGRWVYKMNNLKVAKDIEFYPKVLFGKNGVAPINSTIGVAIKWEAQKSMLRGVEKQFSFTSNDDIINKTVSIIFDEKLLKDEVDLSLILYLEESAHNLHDGEERLNNDEGVILGQIEKKKIVFVGSDSQFPVETIDDKDQPLWFVNFNDSEFYFESPLEDCLSIVINKAHKKYDLFDPANTKTFNSDFVEEVMIQVVYQILLKVKHDINDIVDLDYLYDNGTLGFLLKYYNKTFKIDTNNQEEDELFKLISKGLR